jgi:hypothetical protein
MVLEEDRGDSPGVIDAGLPRVQTSDELPRWLLVLGLVAGLTLFVALLRYAIDLLGVVFLIIMVGFSIRALSDWLTEGESVSGWALVAVSGGLIGTLTVALWLFGSHDRTVSALERRVPGAVLTGVEWLEDHGWGRRVLLSGSGIGAPAPSSPQPAAAAGGAPPPAGQASPPSATESTGPGEQREHSTAGRRAATTAPPGTAEAATLKPSARRGRPRTAGGEPVAAQPAMAPAESATPSPAEAAPVATSLTLTSSQSSALVGTGIRLTAVVSAAGASGTPVGTVVFLRGDSPLGTVVARASANGTAVATFTTLTLPIGSHDLVAEFHGAPGFADSKSATLEQIVRRH